jgi:hypothetical protein
MWWGIPVIPATQGVRKEDYKFKASLVYIARPCLKIKILKGLEIIALI